MTLLPDDPSVNGPALSRSAENARLTRLAVVEAAHRLFLERGYAGTSIREIAGLARVSDQTVYRIFGDKAALLRAVVLSAVTGQDGERALRETNRMAEMEAATTPAERLKIVAEWAREAYDRGLAQLEGVVVTAAGSDVRVGELARFIADQRYEDTRSMVLAIVGDAPLPAGIDLIEAVDYIYAVESSPVYMLLTGERGWTTDTYVRWFVRLVRRILLDDLQGPAGPSDR